MSTPRNSGAYPPAMILALERALDTGEFIIPCPGKTSPAALRLQFYGLGKTLRREGKPELIDALGFYLQSDPPALLIKVKDLGEISSLVSSALEADAPGENLPTSAESAEAALARILGEKT